MITKRNNIPMRNATLPLVTRLALLAPKSMLATQPACPTCESVTRTANRDGYLWRVCSCRTCTWPGEYMEAETAAALENMGEAMRAQVMALRGAGVEVAA